MCNSDKLHEILRDKRLRNLNFVAFGLVILGLILRPISSGDEDSGVGNTPTFLFALQFIITIIMLILLVMGELHKPTTFLICFPLVMSRTGRGAILLMISLPLTNFESILTVLLAIICSTIGVINIIMGFHDSPVELKFAEDEGHVPTRAASNAMPPT